MIDEKVAPESSSQRDCCRDGRPCLLPRALPGFCDGSGAVSSRSCPPHPRFESDPRAAWDRPRPERLRQCDCARRSGICPGCPRCGAVPGPGSNGRACAAAGQLAHGGSCDCRDDHDRCIPRRCRMPDVVATPTGLKRASPTGRDLPRSRGAGGGVRVQSVIRAFSATFPAR